MKRQLEIPINPWLLILVTLAGMLLTRCATVTYYDPPAYFTGALYEEVDTIINGDTLYYWR